MWEVTALLNSSSSTKPTLPPDATETETDLRLVLIFFFSAGRLIKGHEEGLSPSRSCSRRARTHYHSLTVSPPPPYSVTLSLLLPPTFSFHPRPTFLVVVVGVAQCEEHKAKLGQILHAAQITLEDCTLSQVHCAARSLTHCNFVLFFFIGDPCLPPHQLSLSCKVNKFSCCNLAPCA